MLALSFPKARNVKEAALRFMLCRPDYVDKKSLDVEMASMVMMMDFGLIFGFAIPPVLLLLCIAFAAHLAVFHLAAKRLGMQNKYAAKPATRYLAFSLVLGCALNLWFFVDNRESIAAWILVCVGVPLSVCAGFGIGAAWDFFAMNRGLQSNLSSPPSELSPYILMEAP